MSAPWLLDEGLGDAEGVDPVVDRLPGLVDGLVAEELGDERLEGQVGPVAREAVIPVPEVLVEQVAGLAFLVGQDALDGDAAEAFLGDLLEGDGVLLEKLLEPGDLLVRLHVDGVVGDDLEDEVDAALEVEAPLDLGVVEGVGEDDRPGDDDQRQDDLPLEVLFHGTFTLARDVRAGGGESAPPSGPYSPSSLSVAPRMTPTALLVILIVGVGGDLELDAVLLDAHDRAEDAGRGDDRGRRASGSRRGPGAFSASSSGA